MIVRQNFEKNLWRSTCSDDDVSVVVVFAVGLMQTVSVPACLNLDGGQANGGGQDGEPEETRPVCLNKRAKNSSRSFRSRSFSSSVG